MSTTINPHVQARGFSKLRRKRWLGNMAHVVMAGIAYCCLSVSAGASAAAASDYPNRPITIVVPWPAGGATDTLARLVADHMSAKLGQPVVVENKPGATGVIGTREVVNAAPDGYKLLAMAASFHTFSPSVNKTLPIDPIASISPISIFVSFPSVLAVPANSPYKTLEDLLDAAKREPGKLTFGSFGQGSAAHLIPTLLGVKSDVEFLHVPYKGSSPALVDLMGGQIAFVMDSLPSPLPHIQSGGLRALAVTGVQRSPSLPDVPSVAELIPGFEATIWLGLGAPQGLPRDIANKLNSTIKEIVADPSYAERLRAVGADASASESPEAFTEYLYAQKALWDEVVKDANLAQIQ